jgi:hypothetical protein
MNFLLWFKIVLSQVTQSGEYEKYFNTILIHTLEYKSDI